MSEYKNVGQGMLLPLHIKSGKQEENGNFVLHIKVSIKDIEYTYRTYKVLSYATRIQKQIWTHPST